MPSCLNCGRIVDLKAASCPGCGRQNPGEDNALLLATGAVIAAAVVILLLFSFVFLLPAMLVIFPFVGVFQDTSRFAFGSVWAWLGSAIFWSIVGWASYEAYNRSKKQVQKQGRQFVCFNCEQTIAEVVYGDMDRGGLRCPYCQKVNTFQQE